MIATEVSIMGELQKISGLGHLKSFALLENGISYEKWPEAVIKKVLGVLFENFFINDFQYEYEKDEVQRLIKELLMQNEYRLSETDLNTVLQCLNSSQQVDKINPGLSFVALTYDPLYIPVLERFIHSEHKSLSENAKRGIDFIRRKSRF